MRFQSTLPVWGGTQRPSGRTQRRFISIHPPRVGRDLQTFSVSILSTMISIHPPRVGRDFIIADYDHNYCISIHPPRVGRDRLLYRKQQGQSISIHPPRVGRDPAIGRMKLGDVRISIHPPRVGRDAGREDLFRSHQHFNPPSPCGEGHRLAASRASLILFQSTLPVWGGT